ncbi:hypothetical protein Fmac_027490 [Flemingia macrophylla]|uniref:Uncharacterized protein n=1 Tax=Flemingia macrophylla TaxID=520843 RepID=A0ABD1LHW3_9FABA
MGSLHLNFPSHYVSPLYARKSSRVQSENADLAVRGVCDLYERILLHGKLGERERESDRIKWFVMGRVWFF